MSSTDKLTKAAALAGRRFALRNVAVPPERIATQPRRANCKNHSALQGRM